jgi:hypothetical protein
MADAIDERLEATLRAVLRGEADALPFTLRAKALEQARSERVRARRHRRWSFAAAAAVVVVVAGVALATALRPLPPAASPGARLAGLPSFERLAEAGTGGGAPLLRLEGAAGAQADHRQYGLPRGAYAYEYLAACSGPAPLVVSLAAASVAPVELGTVTCDGGLWRLAWDGTDEQAILAAASASLVVDAQPGTGWRMVVVDDGSGRIVQHFGTSSRLFRLPSFAWLVQQRSTGAIELVRDAGLNAGATSSVATLRGIGAASSIEVFLSCVGNPVELSLVPAGSATTAGQPQAFTCDGTRQGLLWQRSAATRDVSEIRLAVPAGTAWEAIVWDTSAAPDAPAPPTGSP